MTSLIVNYIPQEMSHPHLLSIFSAVGSVESCKIMRDHQTGYSHGYGFVTYATPEDAQKAILQLNGYQVGNKRIKVSYSRPSGDEIKNTNLYITNLPRHYTVDDLENIFGKFGRIVQKNLLKDKVTDISRGVAFVRFDKRDEADRAIVEMDGKVLGDRGEALSVKVAEEHGKQKAAFYIGWQAGLRHCFAPFPPGLYGSHLYRTPTYLGRSDIRAGKPPLKTLTTPHTSLSHRLPCQNNWPYQNPANDRFSRNSSGKPPLKTLTTPNTSLSHRLPCQNNWPYQNPANDRFSINSSAKVIAVANNRSFPYQFNCPSQNLVQYPLPIRPTRNRNTGPTASSQFRQLPAKHLAQ